MFMYKVINSHHCLKERWMFYVSWIFIPWVQQTLRCIKWVPARITSLKQARKFTVRARFFSLSKLIAFALVLHHYYCLKRHFVIQSEITPKLIVTCSNTFRRASCRLHARGEGTPLYGLYRYVRPQRVWIFSRFGHKLAIDFSHFAAILVINRVRVLGSGPHTHTQFFWEYPPPQHVLASWFD